MSEAPPTDAASPRPQAAAPDGAAAPGPPADPADGIGRRVSAIRARRGLGVSELARRVGVSPSLISQIERAQSRPSVSTLFAISRALEVPVDAFFAQDGNDAAPGADRGRDGAARPGRAAAAAGPSADAGGAPTTPAAPPDGGAGATGGEAGATASRFPGAQPGPRVPGARDGAAHERYLVRRDGRVAIDIQGGVRWERLTPATQRDWDFLELVYGPGAESHASQYRHPGSEAVLVLSGRLDIYVGFERYELGPGDSIHFPSSRPHRYVNPTDEETRAVTVIRHDDDA